MGTAKEWLLPESNATTGQAKAYRGISTAPVVNLEKGAQDGFMVKPTEFVASANYIPGNVVCILVEAPGGFNKMDDGDFKRATLKSLVEEQARTIEGLNTSIKVEMSETPVGGAGEMHQDVKDVTRERTVPAFMWNEKIGRAVSLFFEDWILQLGMDPETKVPQIVNYRTDVSPKDFLPSFRTMTCLFFEPDPSFRSVVKAWLCTNMFPLSAGENIGKRDLTASGDPLEVSIEFSAVTQIGLSVTKFAQNTLNSMNLSNANPYYQKPWPGTAAISTDVQQAESGFIKHLNQFKSVPRE